jgi:hypothetical protein
MTNNCTN